MTKVHHDAITKTPFDMLSWHALLDLESATRGRLGIGGFEMRMESQKEIWKALVKKAKAGDDVMQGIMRQIARETGRSV